MMCDIKSVVYKTGQVYLCLINGAIIEVEIKAMSTNAQCLKIKYETINGTTWIHASDFHKSVKGYIGRYETVGKLFWKRRKLVR